MGEVRVTVTYNPKRSQRWKVVRIVCMAVSQIRTDCPIQARDDCLSSLESWLSNPSALRIVTADDLKDLRQIVARDLHLSSAQEQSLMDRIQKAQTGSLCQLMRARWRERDFGTVRCVSPRQLVIRNVNGRYRLNMKNPPDREILEHLLQLSRAQGGEARKKGLPDTSQHGTRSNFRNVLIDSRPDTLNSECILVERSLPESTMNSC